MSLGRPLGFVLSAFDGLLDRAVCVVGAILLAQLPEFIQQYVQRLGGHLDEARRQLAQFQDVAARSGLTLDQLVAKTQASMEPAVARLGAVIQDAVTRVADLAAAETAIRSASLFMRPFVFVRNLDPSIAWATWAAYKFAVPITLEGLAYALVGVVIALGLYHALVGYPLRRLSRGRARPVAVTSART